MKKVEFLSKKCDPDSNPEILDSLVADENLEKASHYRYSLFRINRKHFCSSARSLLSLRPLFLKLHPNLIGYLGRFCQEG